MNMTDVATWGHLISSVAVLVTLVYLHRHSAAVSRQALGDTIAFVASVLSSPLPPWHSHHQNHLQNENARLNGY